MTTTDPIELHPVGVITSPLTSRADAPRQPDENAPSARLVINDTFAEALRGLAVGDRILVLTWLHRADRSVLTTHPRDDLRRERAGVFATRSPDRPNPVGVHEVTVTALGATTVTVDGLDAIDGTPVLDLKPVLGTPATR